jgi:hypothetical protein
MQVETYETEDATSEASAMANDSAALELIRSCGLKGQMATSNEGTVTRIPYQEMLQEERTVYQTLFPRSKKVEDYDAGVIPLRVLQVIAHAQSCKMFKEIVIWYPETARIDDPVLVGIVEPRQYSQVFYKLARWGKALAPFDRLKSEAIGILRTKKMDSLRKALQTVQSQLVVVPQLQSLEELAKSDYVYI